MGEKSLLVKRVIKLDGTIEDFNSQKIANSTWLAAQTFGGTDIKLPQQLSRNVLEFLKQKLNGEVEVGSSLIGEAVEKVLIEAGHAKTAKAFIIYRENKKHLRQDKSSLGIKDDIGFSYNTLYILKTRYLRRNEKGETTETPRQMIERISKFLTGVEKTAAKRK